MSIQYGCEGEAIFCNANYDRSDPVLTIASPYFHDDPTGWIWRLITHPRASDIEIIIVDDGTCDPLLDEKARVAVASWVGPAMRVRFDRNKGRSQARNRAIASARGAYVLFIDADMIPRDDAYLDRYLDISDAGQADIVFGGFVLSPFDTKSETALHHCLAQSNDCGAAQERALRGPLSVASNNLLVRREVLAAATFDATFAGWGWEDTEWAMRAVSLGHSLVHVDNPAVHLGLVSTDVLLQKYKESGANLRKLLDRHPDGYSLLGAKIAVLMTKIPFQSKFRPIYRWMCHNPLHIVPMRLRMLAAKLWRASYAAQAMASPSDNLSRRPLLNAG